MFPIISRTHIKSLAVFQQSALTNIFMLSRGKPEPLFTSIMSTEVHHITAIWPNHCFGGGGFSCMLYQIQAAEKFNLQKDSFCMSVIFGFELRNIF